jgi:hypothetical protein
MVVFDGRTADGEWARLARSGDFGHSPLPTGSGHTGVGWRICNRQLSTTGSYESVLSKSRADEAQNTAIRNQRRARIPVSFPARPRCSGDPRGLVYRNRLVVLTFKGPSSRRLLLYCDRRGVRVQIRSCNNDGYRVSRRYTCGEFHVHLVQTNESGR